MMTNHEYMQELALKVGHDILFAQDHIREIMNMANNMEHIVLNDIMDGLRSTSTKMRMFEIALTEDAPPTR